MATERLVGTDTTMDAIVKLAEGNPGVTTVLVRLLKEGGAIDPNHALGGIAHLFSLDSLGIYGSRIWCLYKDVCKQDLTKTIAALRACQLGLIQDEALNLAIDNCGNGLDVDALMARVCEKLPAFGQELQDGIQGLDAFVGHCSV